MSPAFSVISAEYPVRLFFALLPPHETSLAIEKLSLKLQGAHRLHGYRIAHDRLHATLAPVFAPTRSFADTVACARAAAAEIQYGRFPVCFEWSESFRLRRDHHPLVLRGDTGVRSLNGFQQEIRAQMVRAGFAVERSFTPHVTLLWADRCVEANPIAPIHWTVRDFVLVLSVVGRSRHTHVERWPLE